MTKAELLHEVEAMIIAENPALADPEYRRRLDPISKQALVTQMIQMAIELSFIRGVAL